MPRVLMLSLVYGPDTVSTANLMTELARGLKQLGHQVTVLTSMPHYNPSSDVLENPIYRAKPPALFTEVREDGIRVFRVYMPLKRRRIWLRALDFLWFHAFTLVVAAWKIQQQDVVFVVSPPITLGVSGYLLAKLSRARMIYDLRELWPDVPVRMGVLRNELLVGFVCAIERFVYSKSTAITSISRCFNDTLVNRQVPREKLHFTPNFVDIEFLRPRSKVNEFSLAQGLLNKFVILYAGNIGLTQGLEVLIEVAQLLRRDPSVIVILVGDGAGRPKLEQSLASSGLQNVRWLPFQPANLVPQLYASADVCVSPMRCGFSYDTVPSKIYTAMAAGRPVIAACEPDTEAARLLIESESGIVVKPESAREMAGAVDELRNSFEQTIVMGQKARRWIEMYYSKEAVLATYDLVIRRVSQVNAE